MICLPVFKHSKQVAFLLLVVLVTTGGFLFVEHSVALNYNLRPPKVLNYASDQVIFPRSFLTTKGDRDLVVYYTNTLKHSLTEPLPNFRRYSGPSYGLTRNIKFQPYHKKKISLYEGRHFQSCARNLNEMHLSITSAVKFNDDTEILAETLIEQLTFEKGFKELQPFFKNDLDLQLAVEHTDAHFYKFAGSSVYLQEFGVHFMVSRVLYSSSGDKGKITTSLLYAQIFDRAWNELKNTELVVPIVDHEGVRRHEAMKFPKFLPMPFFHDVDHVKKKYYGPEDPRTMLIRNSAGDLEPVIIYNSYIRKVDSPNHSASGSHYKNFRSMFMAWPFRYQKGKDNVQSSSPEYDDIIYTKTAELSIAGTPRLGTQKNWSPMLNSFEEKRDRYHRNIYFVYRWSSLSVLRCSLNMEHKGTIPCSFDFKSDEQAASNDVGPLRGGTELINLNDVLHDESVLPISNDKQIWVGFPRAHIDNCGCGKDMYRPNLAVIVKNKDAYSITKLSSFTSLDVEVIGWKKPEKVCVKSEPNVLLPNGISSWYREGQDDYLTLTLSVADATNHMIHIKNLLKTLVQTTDILNSTSPTEPEEIISCSLDKSRKFCKEFGNQVKHGRQLHTGAD